MPLLPLMISKTAASPAYLQLKALILEKIQSGKPNEKLPSINELIRSHGISLTTINRALFSLEKEGLIERRPGKGIYIAGREKEVLGVSNGNGATSILLAYPQYFSHRIFNLAERVEMEATLRQKKIQIIQLKKESNYEILYEIAAREKIAGLILIPPGEETPLDQLSALDAIGSPVVLLDDRALPKNTRNLFVATPDFRASARMIAEHLLQRGHKRVAYVGNEPADLGTQKRQEILSQILSKHQLTDAWIKRPQERPKAWESSLIAGYRLTLDLVSGHRPSAIVYDSSAGAFGGLKALFERGLRVPEDISVVADGSEGDLLYFEYAIPGITGTSFSAEEIVKSAFNFIEKKPSEKFHYVAPVLHERTSVASSPA